MSSNQSFSEFFSHEEIGENKIFEIISMETLSGKPLHNNNHLEIQENSEDENGVFNLLDVAKTIELIES